MSAENGDPCTWTQYPYNSFFFDTQCGWEGVNKEDTYKFCPYCGDVLAVSTASDTGVKP